MIITNGGPAPRMPTASWPGATIEDQSDYCLDAVRSALAGGTSGEIKTLRHLGGRHRDEGVEPADLVLEALTGRDPRASAIAVRLRTCATWMPTPWRRCACWASTRAWRRIWPR